MKRLVFKCGHFMNVVESSVLDNEDTFALENGPCWLCGPGPKVVGKETIEELRKAKYGDLT